MRTLADAFIRLRPDTSRFGRETRRDVEIHGHVIGSAFAKSFSSGIARVAKGAMIGALGITAVTSAVKTLSGAVAVLAPLAAASLAALPGAALAGASALGVLKLSTKGIGEAMKALGADAESFEKSIQNLAPSAQEFARAARDATESLKPLQKEMQNAFFADTGGEVTKIGEALGGLKDEAVGAAGGFNAMLREVLKFASSRTAIDGIGSSLNGVRDFLNKASAGVQPLLKGFFGLAEQAGKFGGSLGEGVSKGFAKFGEFLGRVDLAKVFADAMVILRPMGQLLENIGSIIATVFAGFGQGGAGVMSILVELTGQLASFLRSAEGQEILRTLGESMALIAGTVGQTFLVLLQQLAPLIVQLAPAFADLVSQLAGALIPALITAGPLLESMAKFLADNMEWIGPLIIGILGAAGAVRLLVAAQLAWNLVMAANPIGLVIIGLVALGVALYTAWQNSATFRDVLIGAWARIRAVAEPVINWFVSEVWPRMQAVWNGLSAGAVWLWQNAILPAMIGIRIAVEAAWGWIVNTGWPALQTVFTAVGTVISWLWTNAVVPAATGIRIAIYNAWTWIQTTGWPALRTVFLAVAQVVGWLWTNVVKPNFEFWRGVLASVWGWIQTTGWPALRAVFNSIATVVAWLWNNVVKPNFEFWRGVLERVWGWIANTGWPFLRKVFEGIATVVGWLWNNVVKPNFEKWKDVVSTVWGWIVNTAWPALRKTFETIAGVVGWLWNDVFKRNFELIRGVVETAVNFISTTLWPRLRDGFNLVKGYVSEAWESFREKFDFIKGKVETVFNFFRDTVIPNAREAFDNIKTFVTDLWNGFREKFDQIRDKVTTILDGVKKAFETTKDAIKTTWEKIQEAVRTPINYVINPVYAKIRDFWNAIAGKVPGLGTLDPIAQMASGGVLPGYTPGRDVMYAHVSGGEAIMRPEFTRGVGSRWVNHWNSVARTGGVSAVRRQFAGGFADGGIVGDIKGFFGKAKDFVLGNLLKVAEPVIGGIKGLINNIPSKGGKVGEMAKAIPTRLLDAAVNLLKSKDIAPDTGGGRWAGGGIPAITSWLKAQDRKPYIWASAGPQGYDCSGIVSAVWNLIMGRNPHNHTFSTHSQAMYFTGKPGGLFEAGWANAGERGGGAVGHTSAVFNGIPFEAGGNNGNVSVARAGITPLSAFAHRGSMPNAEGLIKAHLVSMQNAGGMGGTVGAWIAEALKRENKTNWQQWMETLVKRESGGNPGARSFSSNGPLGYAIGLAQLLATTFAAYRDRSLPNDRTDPIANLVASIRYIVARYGSIFNVSHADPNGRANPGGYWRGGIVPKGGVKLFDKGGWIQPGAVALNGGTKPELATPEGGTVRLHPKDLRALGEIIGSHVARAIGTFGTATARSADLISRS